MTKKTVFVALWICLLTACTDTDRAAFSAYGDEAVIRCYSGGQPIVTARSTGRVQQSENGSDGFKWKDKSDGLLHESNADCVVIHGAPPEPTNDR